MTTRIIANRYEIKESLGRGGSSEVYLARDLKLGRDVAVKQLFGSTQNPDFQRQREREKRVYAQLRSSSHVVPLYDQMEFEGVNYLVFELMAHSLAIYVEPLEVVTVMTYTEESLRGLQDVHACGVFHRDIKPGNIFVDRQGSIRLGDFGVSGMEGSISLPAWTPEYLAPEVIEGDTERIGQNSDIYSMGFVVYRLLLGADGIKKAFPDVYKGGRTPEAIKNLWMMWHNNLERKAPALTDILSEVPQELSDWLLKMVEKDPAMRYQTACEALGELRKLTHQHEASPEEREPERPTLVLTQPQEHKPEFPSPPKKVPPNPETDSIRKDGKSRRKVLYAIGGAMIVVVVGFIMLRSGREPVTPPSVSSIHPDADSRKGSQDLSQEGGRRGPQANQASAGKIVIITDLACIVSLNDTTSMSLHENQMEEFPLASGEYSVRAQTTDGLDHWGPVTVEVSETTIPTVFVNLVPLRERRVHK